MIVGNYIEISKDELSRREWDRLFKAVTYTDGEGNVYKSWRAFPSRNVIRFPRGAWSLVPEHVQYEDRRVFPKGRKREFKKELDATLPDGRTYSGQKDALAAMLREEQGLVTLQPGDGKTQIALAFLAEIGTPSLVLVHTEDILEQWREYAHEAIPTARIGVIRGDEETIGDITISTVQTFHRRLHDEPQKWKRRFGAVILDEAHHASARTFEQILNLMYAKYRFGLTATITRADKRHPYMKLVIGPVIFKKKFQSKVPVQVEMKKTNFRYRYRGRWDWSNLLKALTRDEARNRLIAERADLHVSQGHSVLILSRQIEHLQRIAAMMKSFDKKGALLVGEWQDEDGNRRKLSKETRKHIIHEFRRGKIKVVLATQLADEALDVPRLSRVHLTFPGKHDGRIIQQIGRALREHPDKADAKIIDYVDDKVAPTRKQAAERRRTYNKLGIPIKKRRMLK